jgi:hypothetical protein
MRQGDLYSALLPMLVIVNLDLPQRQKLGLYALFSLAFLVVGAGVARTVLLNVVYNKNYDFTWSKFNSMAFIWLFCTSASCFTYKDNIDDVNRFMGDVDMGNG